jgi:hypothetical protein
MQPQEYIGCRGTYTEEQIFSKCCKRSNGAVAGHSESMRADVKRSTVAYDSGYAISARRDESAHQVSPVVGTRYTTHVESAGGGCGVMRGARSGGDGRDRSRANARMVGGDK